MSPQGSRCKLSSHSIAGTGFHARSFAPCPEKDKTTFDRRFFCGFNRMQLANLPVRSIFWLKTELRLINVSKNRFAFLSKLKNYLNCSCYFQIELGIIFQYSSEGIYYYSTIGEQFDFRILLFWSKVQFLWNIRQK